MILVSRKEICFKPFYAKDEIDQNDNEPCNSIDCPKPGSFQRNIVSRGCNMPQIPYHKYTGSKNSTPKIFIHDR